MLSKALLLLPVLGTWATIASATPLQRRSNGINPADFKYEGLVAIGQYPASNRDKNGETIGGFGSAAGLVPGKFSRNGNVYSGSLFGQPDRGYNVNGTIDYVARHHTFDFQFTEYTGSSNLTFDQAKQLFNLTYRDSLLYHEPMFGFRNTTGLDSNVARLGGLTGFSFTDGPLGAASNSARPDSISFDTEGFSANLDGTFWASDEYTPGIYKIGADGSILAYITPPEAVLPRINGQLNFTSLATPDTGRNPNAGFEGMTLSWDGKTLYAALQSALVQDGGDDAPYLRLFEWDISSLSGVTKFMPGSNPGAHARLVGEYVYKVATTSKGKAENVSDMMYIGPKTIGLLVRDGHGFGSDQTDVSYKRVDILDLSTATNIAGRYDQATGSIAPNAQLVSGIHLAAYSSLVDYTADLARFGMHASDAPVDDTLLAAKIESLVLLPTLPASHTDSTFDEDEYFLISISDNDFQTKDGYMRSIGSYSAPYPVDVPTQIFVFKVKLPGLDRAEMLRRLGL